MLAFQFGCTVAELAERLTVEEFGYWQAFYQIQPFGEEWQEHRIAFQTASILQSKTKSRLKVDDFSAFRPRRKKQTAAEQQSIVLAAIEEMNRAK